MPQAPELKTATMAGIPAVSFISWVDRPKLALVVSVYTFPGDVPDSSADLERSAARLRRDVQGAITRFETQPLRVGLRPAVGVVLETDGGMHVEARIVHAYNRIYEIQASTLNPQDYRADIDHFFGSLRIHDVPR